MRRCAECGQAASKRSRLRCIDCHNKARASTTPLPTRRNAGARVDLGEVEHLSGETPERIAERLQVTAAAIAKAYRRAGRPDAARPFDRAHNRQQYAARAA